MATIHGVSSARTGKQNKPTAMVYTVRTNKQVEQNDEDKDGANNEKKLCDDTVATDGERGLVKAAEDEHGKHGEERNPRVAKRLLVLAALAFAVDEGIKRGGNADKGNKKDEHEVPDVGNDRNDHAHHSARAAQGLEVIENMEALEHDCEAQDGVIVAAATKQRPRARPSQHN